MKQTALETIALTKQFRDFWQRITVTAVKEVSFQVATGTVFGLLGPNGSGKTTTLRLMTGLLHPSSGCIRILGDSPTSLQTRRRIGYLPETDGFYEFLSGRDNLRFYAGLFGYSGREASRRADTLLDTVGLIRDAHRPVGEFSKGMKRRIGLAQALLNDPELLILDEPTAGLDPAGCRQVKELLRQWAQSGRTVVVSSHLLADIEDLCESVCILHQGRVVAQGRLAEMLEQREQHRFTTGVLTTAQCESLQESFLSITGSAALMDHPHRALESYFTQVVEQVGQPSS